MMSWLTRKANDWLARNGYYRLAGLSEGGSNFASETVSIDTALNLSVVWACTRILSGTFSYLPLDIFQKTATGRTEYKGREARLLHLKPNQWQTSFNWREQQMVAHLLRGNCYSQIIRRSSDRSVLAIQPLTDVEVVQEKDYTVRYFVTRDMRREEIPAGDIIHVPGMTLDGPVGMSIITAARNSIGAARAADRYAGSFYANGGRVPYVLETPNRFKSEEDARKFRADWSKVYGSKDGMHVPPILDGGIQYKQIGLSPDDSQFLETRQFNVTDICRWFGVQPHLVGDLSRATNNNIEHQSIEHVVYTLSPLLKRFEQEYTTKLFPDRDDIYVEFNVDGILRGDFFSRVQGLVHYLQNGVLSVNEVRTLHNWNPIKEGETHHIQLNMQPLPAQQPQPKGGPQA